MNLDFLDFEQPIAELEAKIDELRERYLVPAIRGEMIGAIAVTEPLGHQGYRKAVVLGLAYAATIGGVGSAITSAITSSAETNCRSPVSSMT